MMKRLKIIIFIFLFALLWLPFIQEKTKYFKELKLTGAYIKPEKPFFSIESFKKVEFQKKFEDYENSNFGFRAFFVKIRNSVDNILFSDLSVADNTAGKNEFIFSIGSTERTLGIQYNGKEKNDSAIDKIKFLQEGIEKHGGHFLAVIVPSKETGLPDFLPHRYLGKYRIPNDYTDFVNGYKKDGIHFIDFCPYFKNLRDTCKYSLFTKTGFHWSLYGAAFAQDSILNYIEKSLGTPIPKYKRNDIELSDKARDSDDDFENSLNLFFSVAQSQYAYPKFEMVAATTKNHKPKVIVIGDSFFWQIKNQGMLKQIFSDDSRFWFYFATTSYSLGNQLDIPLVKDERLIKELDSADYVILFSNIGTLYSSPYGVADFYYNGGVGDVELIKSLNEKIKNDSKWIESLTKEKKSTHLSVDKLIETEVKRVIRDKTTTYIKAANNMYLCAGGTNDNVLFANRKEAALWETFSVLKLNNDQVIMRSYKNKLLSAQLNSNMEITADRSYAGNWETFSVIKMSDDTIAFKAANGKYLTLNEKTFQLFATVDVIGKNEKFKLEIKK